jgi:hypothetical protein
MPIDHNPKAALALRAVMVATVALLATFTPAAAQTIGMVADNLTGSVTIFDADTDTVLGTVTLPNPGPTVGDCSLALDRGLGFVKTPRSAPMASSWSPAMGRCHSRSRSSMSIREQRFTLSHWDMSATRSRYVMTARCWSPDSTRRRCDV